MNNIKFLLDLLPFIVFLAPIVLWTIALIRWMQIPPPEREHFWKVAILSTLLVLPTLLGLGTGPANPLKRLFSPFYALWGMTAIAMIILSYRRETELQLTQNKKDQ